MLTKEPPLSPLPEPASVARPWTSAYPPGVPPSYDYPVVPLTRFLDDAARDFPVGVALRFQRRSWTWSELRDLVDRAAAQLADLGVVAGDRVAVVSPSSPAAVVASFATWRLGAALVPLDPTLPAGELGDRLVSVQPSVVVTDVVALDAVTAVRHLLPSLRHVVATDPVRWVGGRSRVVMPVRATLARRRVVRRDDDVLRFDALLAGGPALVRQAHTTPSTHAAVLFTGGTTGIGRAVVLTHGNLVANAFQTRLWVADIRSGHETVLGALPLWHAYGLTSVLLTGALAGATIVLVPRVDAGTLLTTIDRERPTLFPGVPRMYQAIAEHPQVARYDLSSLRVAVSGGAPLDPSTVRAFERVADGVRLRQGYGMSESSPLTHAAPVYGPVVDASIGLPVTDTVAIVRRLDDPEQRADVGELGELLVSGPQVMAGYWVSPEESPESPGAWLATGDLATVSEDGTFHVRGRVGDLVQRRGRTIVPAQVEEALRTHPAVGKAVLIPVTAPDGQERAVAVVVPRGRLRPDPLELLAHLEQLLPVELLPDEVVLRDALPESALGKVLRRTVRAELEAASRTLAGRDEGIEEVAG